MADDSKGLARVGYLNWQECTQTSWSLEYRFLPLCHSLLDSLDILSSLTYFYGPQWGRGFSQSCSVPNKATPAITYLMTPIFVWHSVRRSVEKPKIKTRNIRTVIEPLIGWSTEDLSSYRIPRGRWGPTYSHTDLLQTVWDGWSQIEGEWEEEGEKEMSW